MGELRGDVVDRTSWRSPLGCFSGVTAVLDRAHPGAAAVLPDELPGLLAEERAGGHWVSVEGHTAPRRQELGRDRAQSGAKVVVEVERPRRAECDLLLEAEKHCRRVFRRVLPSWRSAAKRGRSRVCVSQRGHQQRERDPAEHQRIHAEDELGSPREEREDGEQGERGEDECPHGAGEVAPHEVAAVRSASFRIVSSCRRRAAVRSSSRIWARAAIASSFIVVVTVVRELSRAQEIGEPPLRGVSTSSLPRMRATYSRPSYCPRARDADAPSARSSAAQTAMMHAADPARAEVVEAVVDLVCDLLRESTGVAANAASAAGREEVGPIPIATGRRRRGRRDPRQTRARSLRRPPVAGRGRRISSSHDVRPPAGGLSPGAEVRGSTRQPR